jgi:hypothetical protein
MNNAGRRREPRHSAKGTVRLASNSQPRRVFDGTLVDISASGFRVTHNSRELCTGDKVRFSHPHGEGEAVVVWTAIAEGGVSSGFLILARQ